MAGLQTVDIKTVLLCVILMPTVALAQKPVSAGAGEHAVSKQRVPLKAVKEQEELRTEIYSLTRSVPPEMAAYALLQLEQTSTESAERRRALLEEAFEAARGAAQSVPYQFYGVNFDTLEGQLANAAALGVDTLSLQSSAAEEMAKIDPVEARSMFERANIPHLAPLTCSSRLRYDFEPRYRVAEMLLKGFTQQERRQGIDVIFLQNLMRDVDHPAKVGLAANLLLSLSRSNRPSLFEESARTFANSLTTVKTDYRSFQATRSDLLQDVLALGHGVPASPAMPLLLQGVRTYLERQLRAPRCAENAPWLPVQGESEPANAVTGDLLGPLNELFAAHSVAKFRIEPGDVASGENGEKLTETNLWIGDPAAHFESELRNMYQRVQAGGDLQSSAQTEIILNMLRAWGRQASGSDAQMIFVEKNMWYSGFIGLTAKDSDLRREALMDYLDVLDQDQKNTDIYSLWIWVIHDLAFGTTNDLVITSPEQSEIRALLSSSPNASVRLMSKLALLERVSSKTDSGLSSAGASLKL